MIRGESVKVLIDYDLFDNNAKNEIGIYLKTSEHNRKHLVHFLRLGEWGEFKDEWIERVDPGVVPPINQEFVSRVRTMTVSYAA